MTSTSFIGFDDRILGYSGRFQIFAHRTISWMMILNLPVFYFGAFHFFNVSVKNNFLLYFIVFFLSYVFLAFTRMIVATHDHDLGYYNRFGKLERFRHNNAVTMRFIVLLIFVLLAATGYMLWTTEALIYEVIAQLKNGKFDHQPEIYRFLAINDNNFDLLDNVTDRMKILRLVLGPYRFFLVIPYLLTAFIMLLPFVLKMYQDEISNGRYELKETKAETELVLASYEFMWDEINFIRKNKYGLPPYRYESFWDPPFNKIRRYPPFEKVLK